MNINSIRQNLISPLGQSSAMSASAEALQPDESLQFAKQLQSLQDTLPGSKSKLDATSESDAEPEDPIEAARKKDEKDPLRVAFQQFVGQTMFSQMIASMRSTLHEPAYFHGGQAERIFQGQLDQVLSEEMTKSSASTISDPMFKLFQLRRN